jgi:hypothetical protein
MNGDNWRKRQAIKIKKGIRDHSWLILFLKRYNI